MPIRIAKKIVMSHLHPVGGAILARRETRRVQRWLAACRIERTPVAFLTLTYDPKRYSEFVDAATYEEIYNDAKANRHVSRFFNELGTRTRRDFSGCWRAKMEFTKSGLIHFHILVRGWSYISHSELVRVWGRGAVNVKSAKRQHAAYIAKYSCKGGHASYPDFIYDQPVQSVKIWGTSHGFWSFLDRVDSRTASVRPEELSEPPDDPEPTWRPPRVSRPRDTHSNIRDQLSASNHITMATPDGGDTIEFPVALSTIECGLYLSGYEPGRSYWGHTEWDVPLSVLRYIAIECQRAEGLADTEATFNSFCNAMIKEADSVDDRAEFRGEGGDGGGLNLFIYQNSAQLTDDETGWHERRCGLPRDQWPDDIAPF